MRKYFIRNKMLVLLMIYCLVVMVSIVILSTVMFDKFSKSGIQDIDRATHQMLQQSEIIADTFMKDVYMTSYELCSSDPDIIKALYGNEIKVEDLQSVVNRMNRMAIYNPVILSVYLYNEDSDKMITNNISVKSLKEIDEYDSSIIDLVKSTSKEKNILITPRSIEQAVPYKRTEVITLLLIGKIKDEHVRSALIVNLDEDKLKKLIFPSQNGDKGKQLIVGGDGRVLLSEGKPGQLDKKMAKGMLIEDLPQKQKKGVDRNILGDEYRISSCGSNIWNWNFVSITEKNELLTDTINLQKSVISITFLFVILAGICGAAFSIRIYRPVHQLLKRVRKTESNKAEENNMEEVRILERAYDRLLKEASSSKKNMLERQNQTLCRLLQGEYTDFNKEISKVEFAININQEYYLAILFKWEHMRTLKEQFSYSDIKLFCYAVRNISEEIFKDEYYCKSLDCANAGIGLIIGFADHPDQPEYTVTDISEKLSKILQLVSEFYSISLTAGVGTVVSSIESLFLSYRKCEEAVSYNYMKGFGQVIFYTEIEEIICKEMSDYSKEQSELMSAFEKADLEQAKQSLERFFEKLSSDSYENANVTVLVFVTSLMQRVRKLIAPEFLEEINLSQSWETFKELETLEEVFNWLYEFLEQLSGMMEKKNSGKKEAYTQHMMEMVKEQYRNPEFTVEDIAANMSLSVNYVRTTFKSVRGQSLAEYLNQIRFEEAARLLKETKDTAGRISELAGFPNQNYFYVAFKKYFKKTPDQYRRGL